MYVTVGERIKTTTLKVLFDEVLFLDGHAKSFLVSSQSLYAS